MDKENQVIDGSFVLSARKALGMSQGDFAAAAGVDRTTINTLESGLRQPQAAVVAKIERLLRGHGLMQIPWTPEEAALLDNFRSMTKNGQSCLLGVAKEMKKKERKPKTEITGNGPEAAPD